MDHQAFKEDMIASFSRIRQSVEEAAARIPPGKEGFRPWPGAISLAGQFIEMVNGGTVYLNVIENRENRMEGTLDREGAWTVEQVVEAVRRETERQRERLMAIPPERLGETRQMRAGPVPVWQLMRRIRDHDIHHRGQVFTYLRMLGRQPTALNLGHMVYDREELIDSFRRVRAQTIECWRRIPEGHLDFRPWDGAMSARGLALHLAAAAVRFAAMVAGTPPPPAPPEDADHAGVLRALEESLEQGIAGAQALTEEQLNRTVTLRSGAQVPARSWFAAWRDHEIHHRGQLYLYARLLGQAPPPYVV